ncbi:beta-ketoacyl-[acyl-carrier-protein] synthase family protein [Nocardiopsis alborubida]|uniref:Beta-ketoacyl-[acyl-carrier-protein] synthase family protein n=2 Tax=Nocardiopsis TaxID=2013 RepID=A0A7X6RPH1_9ACTN|nr:beta-ketoacyl-[acyl-carrier-protein] synthase family protein [Nocardiopsis alborubida]NKY97181.1 beta-ketoacyl-[acyl-carrier-protein] synthase family protein [Nocardiopsis alborubida]QOP59270.1 beta-ketoacyl-ACP synthase [Nocardiopsis sp.]
MSRRAVITGIGVVAPGGVGRKEFWSLVSEGRTATRALSFFDPSPFRSRIAAEADFTPELHGLTSQEIRRMDRSAQFAVVASREAVQDSGLEVGEALAHRTGVSIGSAVGASMNLEREYRAASDDGRLSLVDHAYTVPQLYGWFVPSTLAAETAWATGAQGPATVVSTGCTSGLDSVGYAVDLIREGTADVMIAGGTDAPISPITVACFDAIRATSPNNDDPEHASRPFDNTRNGFVLAEGCAVLVVEELEHARRRGAQVYAEIRGFASRANAYHMTGLRPDGREMADAIRAAMAEARVAPEEIDYVNAHGSGTKQNDRHETGAFKESLGEHAYRTPVSSLKSMVGHSLGAIGTIEIAACALAIRNDVVPPTANLTTPDPECDLDYVPVTAREWRTDTVLTVGSGFGGFQSAMVLSDVEAGAR